MEKTQVIRKDFLVLVIDVKTGKVSTDGGPFRDLELCPAPPKERTPPEKEPPPPPTGPIDDYVCGRRMGEPTGACRWFQRVNGVYYDTGISCVGHPVCYVIP